MENSKIKLDKKSSASMILAVLVCFVMVTIYMISSNLTTSYALPSELDAKDVSQINTKIVDISSYNSGISDGVVLAGKWQGTFTSGGQSYTVDLFCLEYEKGMPKDVIYNKLSDSSKYIDDGISYIINTAYQNSKLESNTVTLSAEDYYAAQTAIWIYQLKVLGYQANAEIEAEGFGESTESINKMWNSINSNHASGVASKIYNYVMKAKAVKESTGTNAITLSDGNPELKLSSDKAYYETDLISVNVTTKNENTTFNGFKFEINDNSYNTTVVDENGNVITDLNSLQNKSFKIRVNATNLNAGTEANITGKISGIFTTNSFLAYQRVGENSSKSQIALLVTNNKSESYVELKANVKVPDTGADYSKYIYIIGAMVLVIGLSVIYVNAKAKQQ